jgi:hypothetical protein
LEKITNFEQTKKDTHVCTCGGFLRRTEMQKADRATTLIIKKVKNQAAKLDQFIAPSRRRRRTALGGRSWLPEKGAERMPEQLKSHVQAD